MSELVNLIELIRDTQAEIARAENAVAKNGLDLGLELAIDSLERRLLELEQQFAQATAVEEIDVCSYRLMSGPGRYPVAALGRTFVTFQNLFSVLYDVIKRNQPRKRANLPPESTFESAFDFGYAYSGSLGFVFTLPNERMLLGESLLDMAMGTLMQFPQATSTEQISELAHKYGAAPVRLAYQWARAHVDAGMSVDVQWRRQNEVRLQMLTQVPDLQRLTDLIASTSDIERDNITVYGQLVGIDTAARTFHLIVDQRTDIRGSLHATFKRPEPCLIDHYYTAKIEVETRVHYATETEDKNYFLMSLTEGLVITNDAPTRLPPVTTDEEQG